MDEYTQEGRKLLEIILALPNWPGARCYTAKDMSFVRGLREDPERPISQRMVFWLRDIRDRGMEDE